MSGCRALKPEEIKKLISSCEGNEKYRNSLMFVLQLSSGFRISEILSLKLQDIWNFRDNCPLDEINIKKENMKGKKQGRIVVNSELAKKYITLYMNDRREHIKENLDDGLPEYVFYSKRRNNRMTSYSAWRIFKQHLILAGIYDKKDHRLGTHALRKTYAQRCYKQVDGNIFEMQNLLGHRSVNSTVRYCLSDNQKNNNIIRTLYEDI